MTFEDFWDAYPRKQAKPVAEKAYEKAIKSHTHQEIMGGIGQFMDKPRQFQPMPATYLNQARWLDEQPEPSYTKFSDGMDAQKAADRAEKRRQHMQRDLESDRNPDNYKNSQKLPDWVWKR